MACRYFLIILFTILNSFSCSLVYRSLTIVFFLFLYLSSFLLFSQVFASSFLFFFSLLFIYPIFLSRFSYPDNPPFSSSLLPLSFFFPSLLSRLLSPSLTLPHSYTLLSLFLSISLIKPIILLSSYFLLSHLISLYILSSGVPLSPLPPPLTLLSLPSFPSPHFLSRHSPCSHFIFPP